MISFGTVFMGTAALCSLAVIPVFPGMRSIFWSWSLGAGMGLIFIAGLMFTFQANKEGPPSIVWLMVNMGLIVPIALMAIFYHEPLYLSDLLLMGTFILMLWLFRQGISTAGDFSGGRPLYYVLLLILVFLTNGLLMFGFKLNQILYPAASKASFLASLYGSGCLLFLAVAYARHRGRLSQFHDLKWGMAAGIANVLANLFLQGAMSLPAVVAFPIMQGLSLLGGVILTGCLYRERLNGFKALGIIAGLAVVLQAVLR